MTTRWIGALLIVLGGSWSGLSAARALHARVRLLAEVAEALQRLESEIVYRYAPLPEALERVRAESRDTVRGLFGSLADAVRRPHPVSVSEAWRRCVREWAQTTPLTADEVQILESLGAMLGKTHVEDQVRYLRYTADKLMRLWERGEAGVAKESRLRIYLGVAGGIVLAILLV